MTRSNFRRAMLTVTLGAFLGLIACDTPSTPTATPALAPAPAPASPPTAAPEVAVPTIEPSAEPTMAPTESATAAAEPTATTELSARDLGFDDQGLADQEPLRNEVRPATVGGDANTPGPGVGEVEGATKRVHLVPAVPPQAQPGECFAASVASTRADAWRCMVANAIYDPCLTAEDGKTLVCDVDPLGNKAGFKLTLSKPLPEANKADLAQHPWLIQLKDGTVCNFATGVSGVIDGARINYYCSDKSVVVGDLFPGDILQAARAVESSAGSNPYDAPINVPVATVWD